MKAGPPLRRGPKWASPGRDEVWEHWTLLVGWVAVLCTPLGYLGAEDLGLGAELALPWDRFRPTFFYVGGVSLCGLILRVVVTGYTGYERRVGLRIIGGEHNRKSLDRRAFWLCLGTAITGISVLLAFQHLWADVASQATEPWKALIGAVRLLCVFFAAAGTLIGLLLAISRRFSVFGTTSIFGIVLGVAALLVVQSVATGFQHEFERRVLGVYAHINVTRSFGISEYRRFEKFLRTIDGVEGGSPFVYYAMALSPYDPEGQREGDIPLATVLVKGIEPKTAAEVIDVVDHLARGSKRPVGLTSLRSDHVLMPVPDRPDDQLPKAIVDTPDPRGEGWYETALAAWKRENTSLSAGAASESIIAFGEAGRHADASGDEDDDWEDPREWSGISKTGSGNDVDGAELPTMFIGSSLARDFSLGEGDVVRLVDPGATFDHSEEPKFTHYRIAGIFQAGFQEYDNRLVYVDIKELERFKYRDKDIVSGVDLRLSDQDRAPEIGQRIRDALGDEYSVLEWQKLNENLFSSIRTQKNIVTIILGLVIFVACFNVLSALWTMVLRRTSEVAILMSMGATGPQISRIFQVTGMTIGLAGSLAGVAFGLVMCWLVELYGYTLDPEVYFIEALPVEISVVQIAWILGLALSFCFLATIPPSLRAAKLRPVEGLRYE